MTKLTVLCDQCGTPFPMMNERLTFRSLAYDDSPRMLKIVVKLEKDGEFVNHDFCTDQCLRDFMVAKLK